MATSSRLQRDAAICPWTIARKLAETLLQDYPEALKSVLGLLRSLIYHRFVNLALSLIKNIKIKSFTFFKPLDKLQLFSRRIVHLSARMLKKLHSQLSKRQRRFVE
jgi:hypothetical protein